LKTLLFNPGPTNVSDEVRKALASKDMCHRESEFSEILLRVNKNMVKSIGAEKNYSAVLFGCSATGCNEAVISSIHGKVLLLDNGKYSERLGDIVKRYNIPINILKFNSLESIDLECVERALIEDNDITHILFVHHETSTGVITPAHEIGEIARKYNKLVLVDAVSSLGGHYLNLEEDNITFCTVNANKCLEGFPGISFVIGKTEEIKKLKGKSRSYYFDLYLQWEKEQEGVTPYTTPVQLVCAVDVALNRFIEEGYLNRVNRYKMLAMKLREGLLNIGFRIKQLPESIQSNIVTCVEMPEGLDYWLFHDKLKERGITIYSEKNVLGKGEFRIATLGSTTIEDIDYLFQNMKEVLCEVGIELGCAI
jgi:2-aminoethylphosphonate-pyruvate transaminase